MDKIRLNEPYQFVTQARISADYSLCCKAKGQEQKPLPFKHLRGNQLPMVISTRRLAL